MATSGQAEPGATIFGGDAVTRPSMLVTVPSAFVRDGGRQHDVGVGQRGPTVTGHDDDRRPPRAPRAPRDVEHVAEQAPPSSNTAFCSPATQASSWAERVAPDDARRRSRARAKLGARPMSSARSRSRDAGPEERRRGEVPRPGANGVLDDLGRRSARLGRPTTKTTLVTVADEVARASASSPSLKTRSRARAAHQGLGDQWASPGRTAATVARPNAARWPRRPVPRGRDACARRSRASAGRGSAVPRAGHR
jgi:hypothetical protein